MEESTIIEGLSIKIYWHDETEVKMLNESLQGKNLVGGYTYDLHHPHNSSGEYHIHLRHKGNEILAMNKVSGMAHDGYHGVRIPNKAYKALRNQYPDWNWPENQILESLNHTYILNRNSNRYLRPVRVQAHKDFNLRDVGTFVGFFHQFAESPVSTGGGWKERTVGLVENENGQIIQVRPDSILFTDIE